MKYIVIDKDGNDISDSVKVITESTDDFRYCRRMADDMLNKADNIFNNEIMKRHNDISECKMENFGPEFDPERGEKWSKEIDRLYAEIEVFDKQYREMMNIAGDWEDREYAARWKQVVDFLAVRSDNPLMEKYTRNTLMAEYLKDMGVPNLAKYIA